MYIADRYWNNYIGDTDDSITLAMYLADRQKEEISLGEIFSDTGLDKLNGDFRQHEEPLTFALTTMDSDYDGPEAEFYYAIDVITDLAALLLECKVSGSVNLRELLGEDVEMPVTDVCITATPQEHEMMNKALADFVSDPLTYDLSEMCAEEDMLEMAQVCEELRSELYED